MPKDFFSKGDNRILNINDKIEFIKKFHADFIIKQNFNYNFSKITHENFIKNILFNKLKVSNIFVGEDFKFGFRRKGNISFLKQVSKKYNFKIFVINFRKFKNQKISSSKIRNLIQSGKISLVNKTDLDCFVDENGNITRDMLLNIESIEIDDIDLGVLKWTLSEFTPDDTAIAPLKSCVNLGWNGTYRLTFNTPFYVWLLEHF